jgi:NAD(P)-dependent dehydrogenase (short-subunit alcohol dehydrogenase family)
MQDLEGKVVLISGAARGMGKLFALNFARERSRVVITDVDQEELQKTLDEMKEKDYDVYAYVHDVSDHDACFELAEKVESEVGAVDVLINNAGITVNEAVLETSEEAFRRITDVNYLGQVWMMQAFVPGMLKRGSGHVVNMCSIAGKVVAPLMGAYCATKFAFIAITDAMRLEHKGSGVNFTIVNPAYIATGMFEGSSVPFITRWQDPQKVADAVVRAVKKNQAEIFVPRFVGYLCAMARGLSLPKLTDTALSVLGATKTFATMKKDRGRPF